MKHQTLENHFHTPGVGETRFAAGIDILRNKSWYVAPRSSSPVYCAVCGKKIRLSPEKMTRLAGRVNTIFFLPILIFNITAIFQLKPLHLVISILLQILRPILAKPMITAASAFTSWEDENSFKRRLSQQSKEIDISRCFKYLYIICFVGSILTLFNLLWECS